MGYVPQIKSENIFGRRYTLVSGMSREGKIAVRRGSVSNNFENVTPAEKYRSTSKSEFRNAYLESKTVRPAECFSRGFDTFNFKPEAQKTFRDSFYQKRGTSPAQRNGWPTYQEAVRRWRV